MLRDYQQRAIDMVRERAKERPLLVVGTGAGKTTIAAEIILRATAKNRRSIFLVHREELADQAFERLAEFGIRAGRIQAGHPEHRNRPVQVASIPTLNLREHWPSDIVIVDEAAHAVSKSWKKCLDRYPAPTIVIGLTATPIRLDGRGLGDLFGALVEPISTRALIDRGFLVEPRVFAPPIDLHDVRIRAGDYGIPELAEKMTKLVGSITQTWLRHAQGQSTVVFAVNLEHSQAIVAAFEQIGVRAAHLDYKMARKKRKGILRDLRMAKIDMISNVQLLSEGWDLPTLQCAVLARPTKSLALYRQMVGRIMRPPGPCLVLDHAGNTHEHGVVTQDIEWSLDAPPKKPKPTGPAIRVCSECFAVLPPLAVVCPCCGTPVPVRDEADPPGVDNPGELTEFVPAPAFEKAPPDVKEDFYRRLVRSASDLGYKLGWARMGYKARFGTWPRFGEIERAEFSCPDHRWEDRTYGGWKRVQRCSRCFLERPAERSVGA